MNRKTEIKQIGITQPIKCILKKRLIFDRGRVIVVGTVTGKKKRLKMKNHEDREKKTEKGMNELLNAYRLLALV